MARQHLSPCAACPWRRGSLPGYLGASTPLQFISQAEFAPRMPCHCTVDYERADWRLQVERAPRCAGHLVYLKNRGVLPRDPELAALVQAVQADRENVFGMHFEFVEHHGGNVSRLPLVLLGLDDGS